MRIIDLVEELQLIRETAALLWAGFQAHYSNWLPDLKAAHDEVEASLAQDRISRIALDYDNNVIGWIAGAPQYDGYVWELHPLVVHPQRQRMGIGRSLVHDFEHQVKFRGGLTILVGTDDEDNQTSLANVDLYPNVWEHIMRIQNRNDHPYEFYQKLGFVIAGVIPDANGIGKPDILMTKRVSGK